MVRSEIYHRIHNLQSCCSLWRSKWLDCWATCFYNKVRELATVCLPWQHWTI